MQQEASQPITTLARRDVVSSLPVGPIAVFPRPERRNLAKRYALVQRVQQEFQEMPGTCLTLAQATRLFGMSSEICRRILHELVSEGPLQQSADSRYRLVKL